MSREAVLLQWERKIEAAERLDAAEGSGSEPVPLRPADDAPPRHTRRFERSAPEPGLATVPDEPVAERRTITITGQPTPARRRRAVVDAQLAQPDRIALWAFLLGLLLVAVAAGTAHA